MRRLGLLLVMLTGSALAAAGDATETPILVLDAGGHTALVRKVLFTPDGRELISVSDDRTIRTWDVKSGEPLRVLRPPIGRGQEGMLYAAALSPDGRTLAVGGLGFADENWGNIYLIALATGRIERVLKGHTSAINALAFAPDGRRLASGSGDHTARLWDVASGRCEQVLQGHTNYIYGVAFSPDGRHLATASFDMTGRIWSVETGQSEVVLRGHAKEVWRVAWRPDGQVVATGSSDRSIRLWGPDGRSFQGFDGLGNEVSSLTFTADSRGLLYTWGGLATSSYGAALLDLSTGKERVRFTWHNNSVTSGTLSPDGTLAATAGGNDSEIYLWKTADATPVHRLASRGRMIWSAGWSPDGKTIAWGNKWKWGNLFQASATTSLERTFRISDLEFADDPDDDFRRAQLALGSVALESTGVTTVAVKRSNGTVVTLKMADPYEVVRCFTLLPGDRAAVGADYGLYLFDTRSGERLRAFQGHTGPVFAVAPSPDDRYLLSASNDQTLRIWNPDRDEPLLSLFVAAADWIAWTTRGYYAASPGGERLIGWHVNNGPEQMGTFHPASQFHKALYRPDLIKILLETGSVARALKILKERGTTVVDILPPVVFITSPDRTGLKSIDPELQVRAVARGRAGHPVTALRLLLDGRPYEGQRGRKAIDRERAEAGEVSESWTVQLQPGTHRLAVLAESAVSDALSESVEVSYEEQRAARPNLYVLAVGISAYPDPLRLNYAAVDARALEQVLRAKAAALFGMVETRLLTDQEATRLSVYNGLAWLRKRMTDQDVGVIFYAGHGAQDDDGTFCMLSVDADLDNLAGTAVHGGQFKAMLAGIKGRVVVMLDTCHAGSLEGGERHRRGLIPVTDDLVRALSRDDFGIVVMCSSTGREFSMESAALGHGYFTQALTEGLLGRADFNRDGLVYLTELDAYVPDRVKELSRDTQHPVTAKPASVRPFALAQP